MLHPAAQCEPFLVHGVAATPHPLSHRLLPDAPLAGTSSRACTSMGVLQPSARGLFGACPAPASPSAWTDAGAAEPTLSALHPADSGFTVEGPIRKRPRLAQGRSNGLLSAASGWAVTGGAADSDSDEEDEAVSRKRPTPGKAPAAPINTGAALEAAAAPGAPQRARARVLAQHPPPTWAASLRGSAGTSASAAPSCGPHHQHLAQVHVGVERGLHEWLGMWLAGG